MMAIKGKDDERMSGIKQTKNNIKRIIPIHPYLTPNSRN